MLFSDDGTYTALALYAFCAGLAFLAGSILLDSDRFSARKVSDAKATGFVSFMLNGSSIGSTLAAAAAWLMITIPAAAAFLIYRQQGTARLLFETAVIVPAYIIPLRHSRKAPADILRNTGLYIGLFVLTVCLELPYFNDRLEHLRPWHFSALYFLIFAYLIIRNHENIEENIYNKKHIEKSILPKNMRRFNTTLVCIVFALIFLMFNLKKVVMWLMDLAGKIVSAVIRAIVWLMERITPDSGHTEEIIPDKASGLPEMSAQPPSPLLNLVFNILKYFILLYLTYRLVLLIISKLPAIAAKLAELARRLFGIRGSAQNFHESEYVDVTETVLPQKVYTERKRRTKKRRSVKKLRKIADPVQRIRYMYGLILDNLAMYGVMPSASDTTNEILDKASGSEAIDRGIIPFTEIYDKVRYGEIKPDVEMLARAEELYEGVCGVGESGKGQAK